MGEQFEDDHAVGFAGVEAGEVAGGRQYLAFVPSRSGQATRCGATSASCSALSVSKEAQAEIERRLKAAGYKEPDSFVLEHGYCRSVYVTDPNGMIVEFTLDHPDAEKINAGRRLDAHSELKRWLAGDHASNNMFR